MSRQTAAGPLAGVRVLEIAGIGPGPCCGMMLADMGAEVILVERSTPNANAAAAIDAMATQTAFFKRGKRSMSLDLKQPLAVEAVLALVERCDVLIEGFRPGVMERLGLGPEVCMARNAALVYGRMTGWGQSGPLAQSAGHDINYVALAGALYYTGHEGEAPFTPATVVGDVAGGALMLAWGIACALLHARATGEGQVIDAAITDGVAYLMTLLAAVRPAGLLAEPRGSSLFSAAAPWYQSYECLDGHYVSVGALEPQFYRLLLEKLGLEQHPDFSRQFDRDAWPRGNGRLRALFRTRTRAQWCELLEGSDVCFGPVLDLEEAARHPHNIARQSFFEVDGVVCPAPAPRLGRTPAVPGRVSATGADGVAILREIGWSEPQIDALRGAGMM